MTRWIHLRWPALLVALIVLSILVAIDLADLETVSPIEQAACEYGHRSCL